MPATGATGPLNVARTALQSAPNYGIGVYNQNLDVSLLIPGGSVAGTYSAALTVTITPGTS